MRPFDANGDFQMDVAAGDQLRQATARGAGVTLLSSMTGLLMQVAATVILARLLAPRDFGLLAMVTTFSLLLMNFGLNGFTEAIVQRESMSHGLASNLFWINLSVGGILTVLFFLARPIFTRLFHNSEVVDIAAVMSLTILFTSLSVVHLALLKRAMRFSTVSANDLSSRLVSVGVSIFLGFLGWGYWALVAGAVALPLTSSIGAWWACRWVPRLPSVEKGHGGVLPFATNTYGRFTLNYFARNADNLIVGWRFNAVTLGLYKKAYDLFALPASQLVSSITVVAVAALSRLNKDEDRRRAYLVSSLQAITFLGMGLAALLTLTGRDLIRVLLGPKWGPAGEILQFFGPGVGIMMLYYSHGWIHLAIGRADRWLRWGCIEVLSTCLLFFACLPWGPKGIAVAWTLSFWILTIPALWYAGRPIGFGVGPVLRSAWKYIVGAFLAFVIVHLVVYRFPILAGIEGLPGALVRIAASSTLLASLYLGAVVVLHQSFEPVYLIVNVARQILSRDGLTPVYLLPQLNTSSGDGEQEIGKGIVPIRCNSAPLVSILIPAYNAEVSIADTLRSAISQSWKRKEIIVIDDGSKDRTLQIARQFESAFVRVFTQPNQGASRARNKALQLSQGDYVQWLDADDVLAVDKIQKQVEALGNSDSKRMLLSSRWGRFMYRSRKAQFVPTALWSDQAPAEWLLHKLEQNVFMQTATWLVSRELCEAAGPWDSRLISDDDGEYFCRVVLASDGIRFVPDATVYYRTFGFDTLSYIGNSAKKLEAHWLSMRLHMSYLLALEDSQRTRRACLNYLRDSLLYFYPERPDIVVEAQQVAQKLGEDLGVPDLTWKYAWIPHVMGWQHVKSFQTAVRRVRWFAQRHADQMMFHFENEGLASSKSNSRSITPVNLESSGVN